MTEHYRAEHLVARLRRRYPSNAFALLTEVGNATGSAVRRHADAIVMGLWPSRGMLIEGVEIKSHRNDWLRELAAPEKADAIANYCDRWWVCAGPGVVLKSELPHGWGLLVPHGDSLRAAVEAATKEEQPAIGRLFLAAILRRFVEQLVPMADVKRLVEERVQAGIKAQVSSATFELECRARRAEGLAEDLAEKVSTFEEASGVLLSGSWVQPAKIGEAVRFVMDNAATFGRVRQSTEHQVAALKRLAGEASAKADDLEAVARELAALEPPREPSGTATTEGA